MSTKIIQIFFQAKASIISRRHTLQKVIYVIALKYCNPIVDGIIKMIIYLVNGKFVCFPIVQPLRINKTKNEMVLFILYRPMGHTPN